MKSLVKTICFGTLLGVSGYTFAQQPQAPVQPPVQAPAQPPAGSPQPGQTNPPGGGGQRGGMGQNQEHNGLKGSLGAHDPVMIKGGDTYYIFTTGTGIKSSKDRITWAGAGSVFARGGAKIAWWSEDIPQGSQIWAPDITWRDGKYWMYYSVSAWMNFNSSVGLATNVTLDKNDPRYKWEDQGKVISFKNGGDGVNVIDPNTFQDKDGKTYLLYGSYKSGLRMVEVDPKTGKLFNETPKLTVLTNHLGEGVFLISDGDYYYIMASRGRCCAGAQSTYQIVMGRSKNITGPYLAKDGGSWVDDMYTVLLAGDEDEPGRGHNGIFAEGDTTYLVYHAYTKKFNFQSMLNIRPLYASEDGWPSVEPTKKLFKMAAFQKKAFVGK